MKTSDDGTEVIDTMEGLEKYIRDRGYNVTIEWKGIDDGGDYDTGKVPYLEWIQKGTMGTSNAILSVGFYNQKEEKKDFEIVEGHFVTAAGFNHTAIPLNAREDKEHGLKEKDTLSTTALSDEAIHMFTKDLSNHEFSKDNSTGSSDLVLPSSQLIVHDPNPKSKTPNVCDLTRISHEYTITTDENLTQPAHQYNAISDIYIAKEEREAGANSTVLDGGFVFTVTQ